MENVIKQLIPFLEARRVHMRVVQMVWEHEVWLSNEVEFHYIYDERKGQTVESFIQGYQQFLETHGSPDLVLATAWPMMTMVARASVQQMDKPPMIISWLHAPIERYVQAGYGGMDELKYADVHFAITNQIAKHILQADTQTIVYRVNNPVKFGCEPHNKENMCFTLAYVGRLSEEKNIETILKAIQAAAGKWRLHIIGTGPEEWALKKLCKNLHIEDRVKFFGWQEQPFRIACKADALVLASYYEGFPLVLVEALSCGLPVISTPTDGAVELIIPGENGFLFPTGDTAALAELLDCLRTGVLSMPDSIVCKQSVQDFRLQYVLEDFYIKLMSVYYRRILSTRFSLGKKRLFHTEKVSIIISCANAERMLRQCLEAVFNQTIGLDYLEVIAVNNESADNTLEILLSYEKLYPEQMMVINCGKNEDAELVKNIGKSYASGKYLLFVDAGDDIECDMIEKRYLRANLYPEKECEG